MRSLYWFTPSVYIGLNPCCNGIYSMRGEREGKRTSESGLNPCCNGIYSMSLLFSFHQKQNLFVLILVVMEYTQWDLLQQFLLLVLVVLILVVMEYTQWVLLALFFSSKSRRLNPCCNGIYSMRFHQTLSIGITWVLILVVMEYTQWDLVSTIL